MELLDAYGRKADLSRLKEVQAGPTLGGVLLQTVGWRSIAVRLAESGRITRRLLGARALASWRSS